MLLRGYLIGGSWSYLFKAPLCVKKPLLGLLAKKIREDNVIYALLSEKEYFISEVDRAREILDSRFFSLDADEFIQHFSTLLCGKALIDAAYFPAQLDFGLGFHGLAYTPKVSDIEHAVNDERHNFLIPYYKNAVLPVFNEEQPDIVGISISHVSEFIPAFTLANLIKSKNPDTHICLGGSTLTQVSHRVGKNPPLWKYFDSLVLGPGEFAFSQLIEHLETGKHLSGVPNLVYKENGSIKSSVKTHSFNIDDACTPEYVSVRPRAILPLETSSGCYWGKCIFCYYPKEGTADFSTEYSKGRVRNIELVIDDMKKLNDRYNPIYIGITDSAVHPRRLKQISEYNLQNKTKNIIKFSAFIRFEKEFKEYTFCKSLAEGGFLGGQVGLESGCQRINDLINKGVDLGDAEVIIKNFYRAGIMLHIYSIVGLPGETKEDAQKTLDFFKRWQRMLTMNWQIYPMGVMEHGPLAARADEFGIELTPLPDDILSQVMLHKFKNGLSQAESMAYAISFYESLKGYLHPVNKLMDIESCKAFLMATKLMKNHEPLTNNPVK